MTKHKGKIITATSMFVLAIGVGSLLGLGQFKQREKVYYYNYYDLDEDTGLVITNVEGQTLTIQADKIVSLPTDYESGNALYVSEYKTCFFTKTVYKVDRFVILVPTDGHGDDWKLGVRQ